VAEYHNGKKVTSKDCVDTVRRQGDTVAREEIMGGKRENTRPQDQGVYPGVYIESKTQLQE
jgi:hypothetical protein